MAASTKTTKMIMCVRDVTNETIDGSTFLRSNPFLDTFRPIPAAIQPTTRMMIAPKTFMPYVLIKTIICSDIFSMVHSYI